MSGKKPLTCQSCHVDIVIRKNKKIAIDKLKAYCGLWFDRYAFIEHDGDVKPDDGTIEGIHYHIVGDMKGKKIAFSTRLNTLVEFFGFDNAYGIEIDQYRTFEGALQYLCHKNQPEKTPHDKSEIIHNLDKDDFAVFFNADVGNVITLDFVFSVCLNSKNIIEVIRAIGWNNYKSNRSAIWDVWRTIQGDEQYQNHL